MNRNQILKSTIGFVLSLSTILTSSAEELCVQPDAKATNAIQNVSQDTRLAVLNEMDCILAAKELEVRNAGNDKLTLKLVELQNELQKLRLKDPVKEAELSKFRGLSGLSLSGAIMIAMIHPKSHPNTRLFCGAFALLFGAVGVEQLSQNAEVKKSKILNEIKTLRWKISETQKQIASLQDNLKQENTKRDEARKALSDITDH